MPLKKIKFLKDELQISTIYHDFYRVDSNAHRV